MTIQATVIFDNAGGITLQLSGTDSLDTWAHHYDEPAQAASDLKAGFADGFGQFEGHEGDADELNPTDEQIRNGGYRVVKFASRDEATEWAKSITYDNSWGGNMTDFAAALVRE